MPALDPPPEPPAAAPRPRALRWRRRLRQARHLIGAAGLALGLALFWVLLPGGFRAFVLHGLRSHPAWFSLLLTFGLLALSLLWSTGQRLDAWVFLHFNLARSPAAWLDALMVGFTQLGSGAASFGLAGVLYLQGRRRLAYELILGTLALWLLVELIKAIIRRPRPFMALTQARIVGARMPGRSFPSGHTSQAFFLATLLVQALQPGLVVAVLIYLAAGLVGLTRMYVGAHYPRDVVAGAVLGSLWGLLGGIIEGRF